MTLSDLEWPFCVKIMFRARQLMGWRLHLSDKTVRKLADRATHILSATKNVAQGT